MPAKTKSPELPDELIDAELVDAAEISESDEPAEIIDAQPQKPELIATRSELESMSPKDQQDFRARNGTVIEDAAKPAK